MTLKPSVSFDFSTISGMSGNLSPLQSVAQPGALVPAVGKHLRDIPSLVRERHRQIRGTVPILHVGRVHPNRDQAAFHVQGDVPLPSLDLPARIAPGWPTACRRLHTTPRQGREARPESVPERPCSAMRKSNSEPSKTAVDRAASDATGTPTTAWTGSRQTPTEGPAPGVTPSGLVLEPAVPSAPVPRPSYRLADRHADDHTAIKWPRSGPWYPPSLVSNLPTGYRSARPPKTSGTNSDT